MEIRNLIIISVATLIIRLIMGSCARQINGIRLSPRGKLIYQALSIADPAEATAYVGASLHQDGFRLFLFPLGYALIIFGPQWFQYSTWRFILYFIFAYGAIKTVKAVLQCIGAFHFLSSQRLVGKYWLIGRFAQFVGTAAFTVHLATHIF